MIDFIEKLAKIFRDENKFFTVYHLSDYIDIISTNVDDYKIRNNKNNNIISITHEAYSICNINEYLFNQLSEKIYNLLQNNKNCCIFIFQNIIYLPDILNKFRLTHRSNCKIYFYPTIDRIMQNNEHRKTMAPENIINDDLRLALAIGGIAEENGHIISDNLDPITIQPIKRNEPVPDKHIFISDDYIKILNNTV